MFVESSKNQKLRILKGKSKAHKTTVKYCIYKDLQH